MRKNSKTRVAEVTLIGQLHIDEDGNYHVPNFRVSVESTHSEKGREEALVVGLCIDALEHFTGLEISPMIKHAHQVQEETN